MPVPTGTLILYVGGLPDPSSSISPSRSPSASASPSGSPSPSHSASPSASTSPTASPSASRSPSSSNSPSPSPSTGGGPAITGVSGTLTHDSSYTITGNNFGTKSGVAPRKYDDFTGGTVGADVGNGWHTTTSDGNTPTYETAQVRHARNSRSCRANFPNPAYLSSFGLTGQSWLTTMYLDCWVYMEYGGTNGVNYPRNHKWIRIHGGDEAWPNLYLAYWDPGTQPNRCIFDQDGLDNTSAGSKTQDFSGSLDASDFENQWTHLQVFLQQSTLSTANGIGWVAIDCSVQINRSNFINRDTTTGLPGGGGGNNPWDQILLGNYSGHDAVGGQGPAFPYTASSYWSDVYIDDTRAHVEIGNNATYGSCTHREVQVPSAWTDTSITITLKQGSFSALAGTYLFVIDEDGNPSSGFLLS